MTNRFPWWLAVGALAATALLVTLGRLTLLQLGVSGAEPLWPHAYTMHGLVRWDSGWYASIAQHGYSYRPGEQSPVAFFPAYPLAVRALSSLTGLHAYMSGVIVSAICGVSSVVLFYRWACTQVTEPTARVASVLFCCFPYAFYLFGVMYSESLFLTLVLGAFLSLEKDRVWLATFFGALATAARPVAPALLAGLLAVQWHRRRKRGESLRRGDFVLLFSASGLLAYMLFQWAAFDEPLAFAHTQASPGWDHVPGWHAWLKVRFFELMTSNAVAHLKVRTGAHAVVAVLALWLGVRLRRQLGFGYAVWSVGVVLIPVITSKDLWGMGRYVLPAFPCFVHLASMLEGRPYARAATVLTCVVLFVLLALNFGRGGWVA